MTEVYLGLGSNLEQPDQQLRWAVSQLAGHPQINVTALSSIYQSRPMGPQDQPDYLNAVIAINTDLAPLALLDVTQQIELDAGRIRKDERWGARVLDIDILLFGQQIINLPRLEVPHYGMKKREFVLYPLAEIAKDLVLPDGQTLQQLVAGVEPNGIKIQGNLR
ncbi:2-amino-4-hydroxy-6-hydroxymethyldihydropteridine diphosphokinase [Thalassotalea mangrovi]|uniref:2-amino-4-hydroxy-6-hydroxymethyldihydropteridine pyrophosphokinase n=1 Tax=Thalassotalea mangrovi TaxID=2572245 RepID=A0A4U1B4Y6_9GAMM|nr:2-amino-4-hydroxy-6-hydroxymethyldihydropteridine diphosphokinase [Thalassotalea mangrovi]TKB45357.1 2-amino-4-hydroxy-6-hydroxymethyldihydropteridine diphosphokinase [Thalassotalea mangrovi]